MMRMLGFLGSLKLALTGMALLLLVIFIDLEISELSPAWLAACLGLMCLNLLAAVVVRPQFRRQPGLLVFHLCLATVAGLAALQALTQFEARVEQAEKRGFAAADAEIVTRGPWHSGRLEDVHFMQGPVTVDYLPDLRRARTLSKVYTGTVGATGVVEFGDTRSFRAAGYRFVTTPNKGYALMLTWTGTDGRQASGNIHMPTYPLQEWDQRQSWRTPAGEEVQFRLDLPPAPSREPWTLSSEDFAGRVRLVRAGGNQIDLAAGEPVALHGGYLELADVVLWIGYRIEYNRVLPWLFSAAALGVAALGWHFLASPPRFRTGGGNALAA